MTAPRVSWPIAVFAIAGPALANVVALCGFAKVTGTQRVLHIF